MKKKVATVRILFELDADYPATDLRDWIAFVETALQKAKGEYHLLSGFDPVCALADATVIDAIMIDASREG